MPCIRSRYDFSCLMTITNLITGSEATGNHLKVLVILCLPMFIFH